jgi:hypothetical protein
MAVFVHPSPNALVKSHGRGLMAPLSLHQLMDHIRIKQNSILVQFYRYASLRVCIQYAILHEVDSYSHLEALGSQLSST